MLLENKIALITAAGQGIGRATAELFVKQGAKVYALDLNADTLNDLKAEYPTIETAVLDATNAEAIDNFVKSLDRVDILFNCVGFVHHGSILDCDYDAWKKSFAINVDSMYLLTKAVLPLMLKHNYGSIINMSSVASSVKGAPNRFVYGTTKAAVIGFTKAIAADFVKDGIRCNAICPGTVQSPSLNDRIKAQGGDEAEVRAQFVSRQPMGRVGTAEEIAQCALYLGSTASSYTTGTIQVIDGGWSN
jgi:2-keto-3-deoxy-L-fuconate dehydrogenase